MKLLLVSTLIILTISACGLTRETPCDEIASPNSIEILSSKITTGSPASIKGKVFDENGEPLYGTAVHSENNKMGALVDLDGNFEIKNIPPGTYDLKVRMIGFITIFYKNLVIKEGTQIVLKDIILVDAAVELKPILYFYPADTISLQVQLDYEGKIIHTYPASNGNWEMIAYPNGTLEDSSGRSYYSIYWEGITEHKKTINSGFIVNHEATIPFLEEKLALLGLNEREANEFIIFWLPILNQNERNFIHFDTEHYTEHAVLNIQPKPETLIRIMMLYVPLDKDLSIPEQNLPIRPERNGFTVVEWGGKKMSLSQLETQ